MWHSRLVWIDAICINQEDLEERSSQVQLMRDLYQRSARVLVWLGNLPTANDITRILVSKKIAIAGLDSSSGEWGIRPVDFTAIINLLQNPYWSRTWIIQEIAVAKSVIIMYGPSSRTHRMTWDQFQTVFIKSFATMIKQLFSIQNVSRLASDQFNAIMFYTTPVLNISRFQLWSSKAAALPYLREVIWQMGYSQATDPRDTVFGILGLIADSEDPLLRPDYTKPVKDVYHDALVHLLAGEDPLLFLHYAGLKEDRMPDLPSWIPDFALGRSHCHQELRSPLIHSPYRASGSHSLPRAQVHEDTLYLQGIRVATISKVTSAYHRTPNMPDGGRFDAWHDEALHLAMDSVEDSISSYGNGQTRIEAFWRTLIGDCVSDPTTPQWTTVRDSPIYPAPEMVGPRYGYTDLNQALKLGEGDEQNRDGSCIQELGVDPMTSSLENKTSAGSEPGVDISDQDVRRRAVDIAGGRRLARTADRRIAAVPDAARYGDEIWVILGSETPHCLRRLPHLENVDSMDDSKIFQLVGECYVHGIMNGEMMELGLEVEQIRIR
jgi:hypothetical protein